MRPNPDYLNDPFFLQDLIDEPMLDVDAARTGAGEVTDRNNGVRLG